MWVHGEKPITQQGAQSSQPRVKRQGSSLAQSLGRVPSLAQTGKELPSPSTGEKAHREQRPHMAEFSCPLTSRPGDHPNPAPTSQFSPTAPAWMAWVSTGPAPGLGCRQLPSHGWGEHRAAWWSGSPRLQRGQPFSFCPTQHLPVQ